VKTAEVLRVALFALWRALQRPITRTRPETPARFSGSRQKALAKLGGACACCGLGMEFGRVLEMHHVNLIGDLHRRILRAFSGGAVTWVLETPAPHLGLFALEVLCVNCHRMTHEAGACPHRRKEKVRRAA
jgi:predicted HNH restriction endonuclease